MMVRASVFPIALAGSRFAITFLVYATLLGAICSVTLRSQETGPQPVKKSIQIDRFRLSDALPQIAKAYEVVVSLEERLQQPGKLLSLSLSQAPISDALNELVSADPRYEWHLEKDGAIRVQSIQPPPRLGDVVLPSFDVDNLYRREISKRLDEQTELQSWLKDRRCDRVEYTTGHDWDSDKKRISLHTTGKTLRENLDQVARESGNYFWSITASGDGVGCQVSIGM
jgi:hypothetical protein